MTEINPNRPNYRPATRDDYKNNGDDQQQKEIKVSRELDGKHDTGVVGDMLTQGTLQMSEMNRFFALDKYKVSSLLGEDNQVVPGITINGADNAYHVLCEDDLYIAGDPFTGGKRNNYEPVEIKPATGFYTMFEDGIDGDRQVLVNAHVDTINEQGNTAFTQYGFIVKNEAGETTKASLAGGQLIITDTQGNQHNLKPGQVYYVGDENDPVAKFYYDDVPGGENGTNETRLIFESYEKPSQAVIDHLVAQGASEQEAKALRSTTQMTFGFRVPDGDGTYRLSEGVGTGPAKHVTHNGVKTYYDAHFSEGKCHVLQSKPHCPPPPPPPPPPQPPPVDPPYDPPPDYDGGDDGGYSGDPHFVGFDGGKYDVQGRVGPNGEGQYYNIVSDQNVQYNAKFDIWANNMNAFNNGQAYATVVSEAGIQVGDDQVLYNARDTKGPLVNGEELTKGQSVEIDTENEDGATTVTYKTNGHLEVKTPMYTFLLKPNSFGNETRGYFNSDVSITGNILEDLVEPHGLLGQTARDDGTVDHGDKGRGMQGGGVVEIINDQGEIVRSERGNLDADIPYQVSGPFATDFVFNRFGVEIGEILAHDNDDDGFREIYEVLGENGTILYRNPTFTAQEIQTIRDLVENQPVVEQQAVPVDTAPPVNNTTPGTAEVTEPIEEEVIEATVPAILPDEPPQEAPVENEPEAKAPAILPDEPPQEVPVEKEPEAKVPNNVPDEEPVVLEKVETPPLPPPPPPTAPPEEIQTVTNKPPAEDKVPKTENNTTEANTGTANPAATTQANTTNTAATNEDGVEAAAKTEETTQTEETAKTNNDVDVDDQPDANTNTADEPDTATTQKPWGSFFSNYIQQIMMYIFSMFRFPFFGSSRGPTNPPNWFAPPPQSQDDDWNR